MKTLRPITDSLWMIGACERRQPLFEGVYRIPEGMTYRSYLLTDEKTVLFDTVDSAVEKPFFENLHAGLGGRRLDYIVVQHMEPDHSSALQAVMREYPDAVLVCNAKTKEMVGQFGAAPAQERVLLVKEGDTLSAGRHTLTFTMAPMVHWPEVMMTYLPEEKLLFSADAFGCFGALDGALFADEVDFGRDYMESARRYYSNIVGKYGAQVQTVLKKLPEVKMLCPLHGFVWRRDLDTILEKYTCWSTYMPEEKGVLLAYASVYGNTAAAADALAARLWEKNVPVRVLDVSVASNDEVISQAFRYGTFVFAAPTVNAGIFVRMEEVLRELVAHGIRNRNVFLLENGSWAPVSGRLMQQLLETCKEMRFPAQTLTIRSALKEDAPLEALAEEIAAAAE